MKYLKTINENIFTDIENEKILISFSELISESDWSYANVAYTSVDGWTLKTTIVMSSILSEYTIRLNEINNYYNVVGLQVNIRSSLEDNDIILLTTNINDKQIKSIKKILKSKQFNL